MMDRRSFVKVAAGAAAGGFFGLERAARALDPALSSGRSLERIGVQLYTVRSLMERDVPGTLAAVAAAGYEEVEFAGYFGHEPAEIKTLLESNGLTAPAAHVPIDALRQDLAGTIAKARAVGHRYLVCPWLAPGERGSIDGYKALAALFNDVGRVCRDAELVFAWHNHEFEFEPIDGTVPFDVLLDQTEPELVEFELDLYWIRKGGADPFAYFERYPGRFTLCHVKDMTTDGTMVEVGAGEIDFAAIFARAGQAGLRHYFVEHDSPADPIASITASHDHLAALEF